VDLLDHVVYRHERQHTTVAGLRNMVELKDAVADECRMPRCPVERAVSALERITGRGFF
jgi:exopolyphosphatase/pppGpp-phosphohydrolase